MLSLAYLGMQPVSIPTFLKELRKGATAFDTRPLTLFDQDSLPGLQHLTLEDVQSGNLPKVPKERPIYFICEKGLVSELVGLCLEAAGFEHVFNVDGGMRALRSSMDHHRHDRARGKQ